MKHLPESAGSPISRMPLRTEGGLLPTHQPYFTVYHNFPLNEGYNSHFFLKVKATMLDHNNTHCASLCSAHSHCRTDMQKSNVLQEISSIDPKKPNFKKNFFQDMTVSSIELECASKIRIFLLVWTCNYQHVEVSFKAQLFGF